MSPDARTGRPRRRRARLLLAVVALLVAIALLLWVLFPWGPIDDVRVERVEVVTTTPGHAAPEPGDTPQRIVVTFSTPVAVETLRRDAGAEFVNATLSACEDSGVAQSVAVAQDAGLFREGRVEALPPSGPAAAQRFRYRAAFDDWLPVPRGSTQVFVSPRDIGGGACFSLDGGAMWMGRLWSDRIPLPALRR